MEWHGCWLISTAIKSSAESETKLKLNSTQVTPALFSHLTIPTPIPQNTQVHVSCIRAKKHFMPLYQQVSLGSYQELDRIICIFRCFLHPLGSIQQWPFVSQIKRHHHNWNQTTLTVSNADIQDTDYFIVFKEIFHCGSLIRFDVKDLNSNSINSMASLCRSTYYSSPHWPNG